MINYALAISALLLTTLQAEPLLLNGTAGVIEEGIPEALAPAPVLVAGKASWYGPGFHGRRTACGKRYNQHGFTAAHRTLRCGTRVRVTNRKNGRSVVVTITDRGPFSRGRVIDLSKGAAKRIGLLTSGVAPVRLQVLR